MLSRPKVDTRWRRWGSDSRPPKVALSVVEECSELGISHVWFHRSFGQGSVDEEALTFCRDNDIKAIPGGCPMMFVEKVDIGHKCMRWFLGVTGGLPKEI